MPRIMGHENTGVIAALGPEAARHWGVKEGDRVALEQYLPCGYCEWCRIGEYRFCDDTDKLDGRMPMRYGNTPVSVKPSLWGGFSQYLYMHPNVIVHKLPDNVPFDHSVMLVPLANGVQWAHLQGGAAPGKSVVIQGPGQMGLGCLVASKRAGAGPIIVAGVTQDAGRLEVARQLGADYTIDVQKEDLVQRVHEITGSHGADVVANMTGGAKGTARDALAILSKIGTIVFAAPGENGVPGEGFGRKLVTIKYVHGSSYQAFDMAIQIMASGKFPLDAMRTHHFGLASVDTAIRTAADSATGAIHVSINPWMME